MSGTGKRNETSRSKKSGAAKGGKNDKRNAQDGGQSQREDPDKKYEQFATGLMHTCVNVYTIDDASTYAYDTQHFLT
jgi:hypothetical protein